MNSRRTESQEWVNQRLREIDAKAHCRCNDSQVHDHCLGCNCRIAEGEDMCSTCEDLKKRRRSCSWCHDEFYLEAAEAEVSIPHRLGFCERCYKSRLKNVLESGGVPSKFMDCTFDGFRAYTKGLAEKLELLRGWVDGDHATGLYLFGAVGTGKTHLAVGLLRALFDRCGLCGKFVSARSFVIRYQTAFRQKESVEDIVDELLRGSLLILDDLGSEKVTDYGRQSLLHLVDQCYSRSVVLVVTSNVDLQALAQIDERIASRIAEMCDRVRFEEPDYRVTIAKNRAKDIARDTQGANRTMVQ